MNPFALAWLALDLLATLGLARVVRAGRRSTVTTWAVASCQLAGLATGITAALTSPGWAGWFFWLTVVFVHDAFTLVGLAVGIRALSFLGIICTAVAVALILVGSFASIAVAALAAVLCVGAALLPRMRQSAAPVS
jgi:hypothetical protein